MVEIPTIFTADITDLEAGTASAGDAVDRFGSRASAAGELSSTGFLKMGSSLSHLGVSAFVVADRMLVASDAVANAHERQAMATTRLQEAVEKYGASSDQAVKAQQQLDIATRGVEIAQERYNIRLIFAVGSVLPSMVVGIAQVIEKLIAHTAAAAAATIANEELAVSELQVEAATGVGIPLAIAGAAAAAAIGATAGFGLAGGFGGGVSPAVGSAAPPAPTGMGPASTAVSPTPTRTALPGEPARLSESSPRLGFEREPTPSSEPTQIHIYGDVNVPGVQAPTDFATQLVSQANRSARP